MELVVTQRLPSIELPWRVKFAIATACLAAIVAAWTAFLAYTDPNFKDAWVITALGIFWVMAAGVYADNKIINLKIERRYRGAPPKKLPRTLEATAVKVVATIVTLIVLGCVATILVGLAVNIPWLGIPVLILTCLGMLLWWLVA